ncbi:MAG: hypothetical protein ACTTK2_00035 [Hoylesella marshii]
MNSVGLTEGGELVFCRPLLPLRFSELRFKAWIAGHHDIGAALPLTPV